MSTAGIDTIYFETHDWAASLAFWRALGFSLDFETDHHSGMLTAPNGTHVFIAEQSLEDPVGLDVHVAVPGGASFVAPAEIVVQPFTATHWGTQIMTVRDPDGRLLRIEAQAD